MAKKKQKMPQNQIIGIVVGIIIVLAIAFFMTRSSTDGNQLSDTETKGINHKVEYTSKGFVPQAIKIAKGDSVTWTNTLTNQMWIASNEHPTHTNYPGSTIDNCGTSMQSESFDSCEGLDNGQSYTFTFDELGRWNYHNHLAPGWRATVIVE